MVVRLVRKYHKWLMVIVGLQFLFWAISGMYMVSMDIHHIHGEPLQKQTEATLDLGSTNYSINQLLAEYPGAEGIELVKRLEQQIYRFAHHNPTTDKRHYIVVNAETGDRLPMVDETLAAQIAEFYYAGHDPLSSVQLLESADKMPSELSPRLLPVWQVTFDHFAAPTFYISRQTGAIVTKRHHYWRLFDWMWRFHIMDYDDGENIANWFLFLVSLTGIFAALAGAVLTYFRVVKPSHQEVG